MLRTEEQLILFLLAPLLSQKQFYTKKENPMADQVKVNDAAWKSLPQDQQDEITQILSESFGQMTIVGDASVPAPSPGAALKLPGGFCTLLCDLAATAGHIACKRLPPPAQPICDAGVDAGAALCKSKCK